MNNKHYVLERLDLLRRIKGEDEIISKAPIWKQKAKSKRTKPKSKDKSDIKTDLALTVKLTKDAELLAWTQEYEFMPMDKEAQRNVPLLKEIWNYWWMMSRTDKELAKVIDSATTFWTWILYEWTRTIVREVNEPTYDDEGNIIFEKKEIIDYDWVYCEAIDFENFYIDWTDIDNSNEAVWIKYWDREAYLNAHKLDSSYKNIDSIPKWKEYTYSPTADDWKKWQDDENIITELRYYNEAEDKFIILANWIEVKNTHIPYKHKKLPFSLFYDYKINWRVWWMGEFELLEEDEIYKDKLRSLSVDILKAQMWIVLLEDDINLDEAAWEYWTNTFIRVDNVNWIKYFSPSINANYVENAEAKLDNEIIAKTWVDIKAQQFAPWETARRQVNKTEVAKKRINLCLKLNWFDFFERIWRLRLANIQTLSERKEYKIPVKGREIDNRWVAEPLNWGYGFFTVKPSLVKWEYNLIPITQTLLWNTSENNKQRALEVDQLLWNIMWADWRPVVSGENRVQRLCDVFEIDYEELTSSVASEKRPEDILKELQNEDRWVPNDATNPQNPDFIPPEQRSWASKMLSGTAIMPEM